MAEPKKPASTLRTLAQVFAVLLLLFMVSVGSKIHAYRALAPTAGMQDASGLLAGLEPGQELRVIEDPEGARLVCYGPRAPLWAFPSGEAAYVYDERGKLVDWTPDVGDAAPHLHFSPRRGNPIGKDEARLRFAPE